MNLMWNGLTESQRTALTILCQQGPANLPRELGEQLLNLGLAESVSGSAYCVSALGTTVAPQTLH